MLATIGAAKKKPMVVNDQILIRDVVNVTLTLDHRYTDGARSMALYKTFCDYLNDPEAAVAKYENSTTKA